MDKLDKLYKKRAKLNEKIRKEVLKKIGLKNKENIIVINNTTYDMTYDENHIPHID